MLRAPADGVVGHVNAEVGELTGGGAFSSLRSGPQAASGQPAGAPAAGGAPSMEPLMTFVQTRGLQMKAAFSETDAATLHTGDVATVTVDAFPGRTFAARVASIDPVETLHSGVVTYEVTLVLDEQLGELRPGMNATAEVRVAQERSALTVPRTAVRSPQGANPSVIVVRGDGRQELRQVATGLQSGDRVQILAGVGLGERVLRNVSGPSAPAP